MFLDYAGPEIEGRSKLLSTTFTGGKKKNYAGYLDTVLQGT